MSKTLIKDIISREILDSRGNPTVETLVIGSNGLVAKACVPSGASTGSYEAHELRDNDKNRYFGKGVLKAIDNIHEIIKPKLLDKSATEQEKIDKIMLALDGTENKKRLGANAILSVSLACTRLGAKSTKLSLFKYIKKLFGSKSKVEKPVVPMLNVINGGVHGCGLFNFQEFMLIPIGFDFFEDGLRASCEVYHTLKQLLKKRKLIYSVGDEGGFTPNLETNEEILKLLKLAVEKANYKYNSHICVGLDMAANEFYKNSFYQIDSKNIFNKKEYLQYLKDIKKRFQLYSLEDPLNEDDWSNWINLTKTIGEKTMIVGDDLLVTNKKRLQKAVLKKACNSILIKLNQIGSLTETLEVIKLAKKSNFKIVVSHRSGETNDDFISDLAVGVKADFVKFGAPARGERVAKYNRLTEIYS